MQDTDRRRTTGENALALGALRVGALLAVPIIGLAGLTRGTAGALTAAVALTAIVGNLALGAWLLGWMKRFGDGAVIATMFGGFLVRMSLLGVGVVLLRPVEAIDGEVLALTVVVGLVALLAYEAIVASRQAELWWLTSGREHG